MTGLNKVEDYKNIMPGITEYPNHRKYVPHHRHKTMDYFEPHKRLIKDMQKLERNHQELTDKHERRIEGNENITLLPVVTLARLEKRLAQKALKLTQSCVESN